MCMYIYILRMIYRMGQRHSYQMLLELWRDGLTVYLSYSITSPCTFNHMHEVYYISYGIGSPIDFYVGQQTFKILL